MTKSLFDGHRLNTVYIPYHVWSKKMLNAESFVRSALYCSFWNSAVLSAVHALVVRKGNFEMRKTKKSFFDPLRLDFEHSKRLVIDKIISSSNMMYWKVFKCELAEGSSGFK